MVVLATASTTAVAVSFVLAIAAAFSNAASNVLQRVANRDEPEDRSLSWRLMWDLLHRPLWLAGLGTVTLSFVLQASALTLGSLSAVQPVIVVELPLTLVAAAVFLHAPLGRREWMAIGLLAVGLAVMLVSLDPRPASTSVGAATWAVGGGLSLGAVAVLVLAGWRSHGPRRAALYGAATGVDFGFTAALMKGTTQTFSHGPVAVATHWTTYAMVAAGIAGMFLMQNAVHAGRLVAAQPGITLLDPFTAVLWGVVAFGEPVNHGPLLVVAAAGAAAMAAGALVLARSGALADAESPSGDDPPRSASGDDSSPGARRPVAART